MKKITVIWANWALFCCVILGGNAVVAQESEAETGGQSAEELAMAEFQAGIALFESGQYVEAANRFRAAMKHKASWKMYYNIGQSEAAAQRYGLALEAFETYLVAGGDDVAVAKKDEVLKEIERLRLLVGVIDFRAEEGASLVIDGYVRGTAPLEGVVRVAAGPHRVQVTMNEEVIYDKRIKFAGGMTTVIDATPTAAAPEVTDAQTDDVGAADDSVMTADTRNAGKMPRKLLAGIITGGAGVVFAGVGVAFLIKGARDDEEANGWDPAIPPQKSKIEDYNDNTLPLNRAMTITGLAVGGAAMAAGAVLIVLGLREKKAGKARVFPTLGGMTVSF